MLETVAKLVHPPTPELSPSLSATSSEGTSGSITPFSLDAAVVQIQAIDSKKEGTTSTLQIIK